VVLASFLLGAGYGCAQVYGLLEVQRLARPDHLAGLTAIYQALTYIGFAASYPLAALGEFVAASVLLVVVAGLALLTLLWTARMAVVTAPGPAVGAPPIATEQHDEPDSAQPASSS
jgi:hypothetical protein